MNLIAEVVTTLDQAQELRVLRNECRAFMTRDTSEISEEQQAEFFTGRIQPGAVKAFLLREDGRAVAYAILRPAGDGTLWMSCGVTGDARGRGLGTVVVRLATTAGLDAGQPVRLEVWAGNEPAVRAYEKAGYVTESVQERGGRVLKVMEYR